VLGLKIYKDGVTKTSSIPVEVGKAQKFLFNGDFSLDQTLDEAALQAIKKPTFNAATGECDNFALEVHL